MVHVCMSRRWRLGAAIAAAAAAIMGSPAGAADLGGDCCLDLEERIAELEATTARKGNRKVALNISGQVNQMVLFWDDGAETNAYIVGNKNDQSNFSFTGDSKVSADVTAGFDITLRLRDTLSDDVDQNSDDGSGSIFQLWQSNVFIESATYGRVTLGQASRVSDTAPENDLSEAGVAGYAGVQDIGGAFILRRNDGEFAEVAWGDIYNHFNGDTANLIRYDTPTFLGFVASVSWGEDDVWDAGLKYEGQGGGFQLAASIAYTEVTDENGLDGSGDTDNSTAVGSIAVLHEPSGLNALVAAGHREFDLAVEDADGAFRTPADAKYIYAKIGWIAKLTGLGPTAFYGEYGWFKDFASAGFDDVGVASLSADRSFDCALAGVACRVTGNEAEVWGVGVVQHIEAAEMQMYLGYRRHLADFEIVDGAGDGVAATGIEDFDTIVAGSKIAF